MNNHISKLLSRVSSSTDILLLARVTSISLEVIRDSKSLLITFHNRTYKVIACGFLPNIGGNNLNPYLEDKLKEEDVSCVNTIYTRFNNGQNEYVTYNCIIGDCYHNITLNLINRRDNNAVRDVYIGHWIYHGREDIIRMNTWIVRIGDEVFNAHLRDNSVLLNLYGSNESYMRHIIGDNNSVYNSERNVTPTMRDALQMILNTIVVSRSDVNITQDDSN